MLLINACLYVLYVHTFVYMRFLCVVTNCEAAAITPICNDYAGFVLSADMECAAFLLMGYLFYDYILILEVDSNMMEMSDRIDLSELT